MVSTRLVALSGKMGVGKSEAIAALKDHAQDKQVILVKFAQPLYDIQEFIYKRIDSVYSRPSSFIKDRTLLQWLGTEWGRSTISKSLWVDIWAEEVQTLLSNENCIVVCDDCRFDNEAEVIKSLGGKIVLITSERTNERINLQGTSHASEAGINSSFVDAHIKNDSTLENYKTMLTSVFVSLGL